MKKIFYLIIAVFLFIPLYIEALELDLHSEYALVYDLEEEKLLYQKGNATDSVKIASLTKIMTSIVALENIRDLEEKITIIPEMLYGIPWDASVAGLKVGDNLTYKDLLYASILPSGADATMSLAYLISGSTSEFVKLMNSKAKELGLQNTIFSNVTGYDSNALQKSTPEEVLKLLLYALKDDTFKKIYTTKTHTMSNGKIVNSTVSMYNKLYNFDLSFVLGSKTGRTQNAGMCMSALIEIEDKELAVITLKAPDVYRTAYNLVDLNEVGETFKEEYENHTFYRETDTLFTIPVEYSTIEYVRVHPREDVSKFIEKKDISSVTFTYDGLTNLGYKNKIGDKIGHLKYYTGDIMIKEEDVFLEEKLDISYVKFFTPKIILATILFIALYVIFKIGKFLKNKKITLLKILKQL